MNKLVFQMFSQIISKLSCTDVLAIRCIDERVFIGIGYVLRVFKKRVLYELEFESNFYPNKIHGIVEASANRLIIFGAKNIVVCKIDVNNQEITLMQCSNNIYLSDWIIAIKCFIVDKRLLLAILLAHNNVCIYYVDDNKKHYYIWCEEKCILYGGSMSGEYINDLTIFSGTVFHEILIWKVDIQADIGNNKNAVVLHRLNGHNGVIFSVVYDPDSRFICSTSDDRTVRLWKVMDSTSNYKSAVNWQIAEVKLIKSIFGHSARVWKATIKSNFLLTVGEDSLMCIWSLNGILLKKVLAHHGAAVWSIDISPDNKYIFTGGADGAVYSWPFVCLSNDPGAETLCLSYFNVNGLPKYVSYLESGTLLTFLEGGLLLHYSNELVLRESLQLKGYENYCIMQVSICRRFVAFASRDGRISIYKECDKFLQHILEEKIMESKIFSLQWLKGDTILVCGANGNLKLIEMTCNGTLKLRSEYTLPASRECWLTAAVIYDDLLICGDRTGNLYAFQLYSLLATTSERYIIKKETTPVDTLIRVHGKIGVQSCTITNGKLMTTGRDGIVRFYDVHNIEGRRHLRNLYGIKMPMDWISGVLCIDNDVLVTGFKESEFMAFSMFRQRVCMQINCGGGHRSWDCTLLHDNIIRFAYIKNKQIYSSNYSLHSLSLSITSLLNGFHVKTVNCVMPLINLDDKKLFVSGGEDCKVRLTCVLKEGNSTFQTLGIFDGHLSSIKAIAVFKIENSKTPVKYFICSVGGRAQMKIWQLDVDWKNDDMLKNESVSWTDLNCHMLYGNDEWRKKPWQETKRRYASEPETRYMDVSVYRSPYKTDIFFIFVGCADGYLRIFRYDTIGNHISLIRHLKCSTRCILKIHVFSWNSKIIALTMATDGIVRYFHVTDVVFQNSFQESVHLENCGLTNCESQTKSFAVVKLHQSGINSYDLKAIDDNNYLMVTGGDDNLLCLTFFRVFVSKVTEDLSISILLKKEVMSAHCAQITGIKVHDNKIFSVALDQQVIAYVWSYNYSDMTLVISTKRWTCISDAQGMVLLNSGSVTQYPLLCVYGNGFELLTTVKAE